MAEFLKKPLGLLDRIYGFVGGLRGTNRVDLASEITLVHDVSRGAERIGYGREDGWARLMIRHAHGGANAQRSTQLLSVLPTLIERPASEVAIWLMNVSGWATTNAISLVTSSVRIPQGTLPQTGTGVASYDQYIPVFNVRTVNAFTYDGTNDYYLFEQDKDYDIGPPLPLYCPQGAELNLRTVSTAAWGPQVDYLFWIGAKGATPPGVA